MEILAFTSALVVAAISILAALLLMVAYRINARKRSQSSTPLLNKAIRPNDMRVPANQLRVIGENTFRSQRPVNLEAFKKVYLPVEQYLREYQPSHRLFAEVGMGSFIQAAGKGISPRKRTFLYAAYGSKRIDFLIIDQRGYPTLAIEYQGTGHELGEDTIAHDQVKRAVLAAAGIPHIEVQQTATIAEVVEDVARQFEGLKAERE